MFLSYFLSSSPTPHSVMWSSRERGSLILKKSSIGFSVLIRSTIFTSLKKDRNSLYKVKIARARTTNSNSPRLGDPGWLDIQPAAGRKKDGKQQLPWAEMMSLDLHKGQVAKICLPYTSHCATSCLLSPCSGLQKLFPGLFCLERNVEATLQKYIKSNSLWSCFSPSLYYMLPQLTGIGRSYS